MFFPATFNLPVFTNASMNAFVAAPKLRRSLRSCSSMELGSLRWSENKGKKECQKRNKGLVNSLVGDQVDLCMKKKKNHCDVPENIHTPTSNGGFLGLNPLPSPSPLQKFQFRFIHSFNNFGLLFPPPTPISSQGVDIFWNTHYEEEQEISRNRYKNNHCRTGLWTTVKLVSTQVIMMNAGHYKAKCYFCSGNEHIKDPFCSPLRGSKIPI